MSELTAFLPGFLAAYLILAVGTASPGPAVAMLLGVGLSRGRPAALVVTAGIATGSSLLNVATLLGVGLLVRDAAWAMTLLRYVGAAYLLWLAWGSFAKAVAPTPVEPATAPAASGLQLFAMGFAMQVTNPKAVIFWLAIAAVGATEGAGLPIIALFVLGGAMVSFIGHGAWALVLSAPPVREAYLRARRPIEVVLGGFFCYAAFRLATEKGT